MKNLYLDIHVLQTVPPSCINRDDTGSPKTAVYGGVTRARVSSQAWKKAMRLSFMNSYPKEFIGVRTKYVLSLIVDELQKNGYSGNAEAAAKKALEYAGIKIKKDNTSDALFFISRRQVSELAKLMSDGIEDKDQYKKALKEYPSVDIALFGRMVASDPSLNFDAAAQVAHSISTHEVRNEYDFFTAVDDLSKEDSAGAGHLGTVEFHSATLYRYATVNIRELEKNLGDDTAEAVRGFVKAFMLSMPTGKQNTFANRTVPDFAYITIRTDQPVNLAGAFEKPVYTRQDGYMQKSVDALTDYADHVYHSFVKKPGKAFCIGKESSDFGETVSLSELSDRIADVLASYSEEEAK